MSHIKYVESNVPKNIKVRVQYLKNDVPGMPANTKRITVATLVNSNTGQQVGKGVSVCRQGDNDNRKIGRAIAVGRAVKEYYTHAV